MNERKSSSAKRMNKVCILSAIEQFVKKNTVMVIALSAAVITMFLCLRISFIRGISISKL